MSQVFAAINHRLSEEYGQIEFQSQEAKDRHVTSVETSIKSPMSDQLNTKNASGCAVLASEALGTKECLCADQYA